MRRSARCACEREGSVAGIIAIGIPYRMRIAEKLDRLLKIERLFSLDRRKFSQQSHLSIT